MQSRIPSFRSTLLDLPDADGVKFLTDISSMERSRSFCQDWMGSVLGDRPILFTKSCTQSLEMAIMALDLPPDAEVIIPSYGFVSLANAVAIRGSRCVFVDCEADTQNICPRSLEAAISERTGAVIAINYGGISCNYHEIGSICRKHGIWLIEDNAHGLLSSYHGKPLGTFGDISTFSFDRLKMITAFEGGAIVVNNERLNDRVRECYEMGTNRHAFRRGEAAFYEWTSLGTNASFPLPLFMFLEKQLQRSELIVSSFVTIWQRYGTALTALALRVPITFSRLPEGRQTNGYIFWIMTRSAQERVALMAHMDSLGVMVSPHYSALHSSAFGRAHHPSHGNLPNTEAATSRLLRLPLYFGMTEQEQDRVTEGLKSFYS